MKKKIEIKKKPEVSESESESSSDSEPEIITKTTEKPKTTLLVTINSLFNILIVLDQDNSVCSPHSNAQLKRECPRWNIRCRERFGAGVELQPFW